MTVCMKWRAKTLDEIADMICGNGNVDEVNFGYRTGWDLTKFFADMDTGYRHDGTSRTSWVSSALSQAMSGPQPTAQTPPDEICRIIAGLMDRHDAHNEGTDRPKAMARLNRALAREDFEAFYGPDGRCYLRHIGTNTVASGTPNPHRPFSTAELERRERLSAFLQKSSEDSLIEDVLVPLLRQSGFQRVSVAGHRDKALEYGKDLWMKFTLPTQHVLYFGLQVKKGKLDASGASSATNANVAEILNQTTMMLGHEIFDPENNRRVLVDHAFIVAGGEITKAARNWLGGKLDQSKRSQVMFIDRDDLLNLFVVSNLPLPTGAVDQNEIDDELPF
jgi:hypothetical protein